MTYKVGKSAEDNHQYRGIFNNMLQSLYSMSPQHMSRRHSFWIGLQLTSHGWLGEIFVVEAVVLQPCVLPLIALETFSILAKIEMLAT